MIHRLILSGFLALTSVSLQANTDSFRFSGLDKLYEKEWDGHANELKFSIPFCVGLDSSSKPPVPTNLKKADIRYQLTFRDVNGGGVNFIASDGQHQLPLELTLTTSGHNKILTPGQDSEILDSATLCQSSSSNLYLTAKVTGVLNEIEAGEYKARINIKAFNRDFDSASDAQLELAITIPKLIKISAPAQISLDGFPHLQKSEDICVYRNGFGSYNLQVTALGVEGGRFVLQREGDLKAVLPYQVSIRSEGSNQALSPNLLIRGLKGSLSPTCQGANKLQLQVKVPEATAKNAYAGVYQGQLKITVEAQ